jgi:hypothetical protein
MRDTINGQRATIAKLFEQGRGHWVTCRLELGFRCVEFSGIFVLYMTAFH